jgi:hypothetical protein
VGARWIHALLDAIAEHASRPDSWAGRTLQQTLDVITDGSKAVPHSRPLPTPAGEQPRSGEIARSPTLLGVPLAAHPVTPPKNASRRPSPAPEPQLTHTTTSLSAFAAAAADQPVAVSLMRARSIPPVSTAAISARPPPSTRTSALSMAPTPQPLASASATEMATAAAIARPWLRMPRVGLLAAAIALVCFAAFGLAVLGLGRSVPRAATGSVSTATASDIRSASDSAAHASGHAEARRDQRVDAYDAPEHARPDRKQAIAIADRYVAEGHQLLKRSKLQAAKSAYVKALRAFPEYPRSLAGITRVELQRKDGAEAVRWARRLIAVQPKRGNNQLLLGDALALHGDDSLARAAWRRAANYGNATARQRLKKAAAKAR